MAKTIDDLKAVLVSARDGSVACAAINALSKQAEKGNEMAKKALADYVQTGSIGHMREHACGCLAPVVTPTDVDLAKVFHAGLSDPHVRYWSILGYVNVAGKGAYEALSLIARDPKSRLDDRAHAVKCIAVFSKQPFDRNLPSDPGDWKETDLRLSELKAWASAGYPDGKGFSKPKQHPALKNPKTKFEKVVSRLDKKLAKKRKEGQDLANPTDWLSTAEPADLKRIKARWDLPSMYLDFLTRFSPVNVTIESRKFYNGFQLFGAGELIEAQDGYSYNPVNRQPIKDWPAHLVVIASHGGDPFVLDLSKSDGSEATVSTAEHGTGNWEFTQVADSFTAFLETLAK